MGHDFLVLGPLQVRGGTVVELQRPSHRRLLSILLLAGGHRQTTDVLIDRFWGDDPPAQAKAALQAHVSALRRLLGPDVIATEGYGYRLPLDDVATDVADFERLAEEVQRHTRSRTWAAVIDAAERALALWRGDPFAELQDDAFAKPEVARLEDLHVEVQAARTAALVACDRHAEALPDLERLVEEHPLHERFWEQLLVARYRLGRHAEALEAYRQARSALADLGLEPGTELRRLERRVLLHDRALDPTPRHNLPVELTSFVGRAREVADVGGLLTEHRLVTLTGIGGAGKTRLAQQVAAAQLEAFPDGCCLVRLGPLGDPDLVAREVATSLGLRPDDDDVTALLCRAVAPERRLILLDNCEHLLESAAAIARALAEAGPDVRVLATSREALRVPGEVVYEVPPMAAPGPDRTDLRTLRTYDAVRLFEDRARLARGGDATAEEDAAVIAAICRRLDGVPLAIELAAARTRVLEVRTIAERLDDRFRLLTGGSSTVPARQRTLEATITWSYDLLDREEQLVFARLSVFRGGFDLDAAAFVAAGHGAEPADAGDLVLSLVERSLVSAYDTEVGRRYRLLETARAYAADRLAEAGDAAAVRRRHLDRYAEEAAQLRRESEGRREVELLGRLAVDVENVQAALDHAIATRRDAEVEMLSLALARHWSRQGHVTVAIGHLERALSVCSDPASEAELRASLSRERFNSGDVDEAYREAAHARELTVGAAPSRAKVQVLGNLALLHMLLVDHDPADAVPIAREALATAEQLGEVTTRVRARSLLGRALGWAGAIDDGLRHQRLALDDALAGADPSIVFLMYAHTFELLYLHPTERRDGPLRAAEELLARFPEDEAPWRARTHTVVQWLPYVFLQSGDWSRAEQLIDDQADVHLEGFERTWHLMLRATLRWMQGRTGEARLALEELEQLGVNPRWYHDYLPLVAEVAADEGRLEDVRACARRYLDVAVDASEEAKKLAVLVALVRAEVDAALASHDATRTHARRAEEALGLMRQLWEAHPPPTAGSVQLEAPRTFLRLAEAELTRLSDPDPAAWQEAVASADYAYTRLYAAWRLVEALAVTGGAEAAAGDLRATYAEARALGAEGIAAELGDLAATLHLDVAAAHTGGH